MKNNPMFFHNLVDTSLSDSGVVYLAKFLVTSRVLDFDNTNVKIEYEMERNEGLMVRERNRFLGR